MAGKTLHRVVVAGGGHGAHVMAASLARRADLDVVWYLPYGDEARRVLEALSLSPGQLIVRAPGGDFAVDGSRLTITGDARLAGSASVILIAVPAFAHHSLLQGLLPHLRPGALVGAVPSRGGFEYEVREVIRRTGHLIAFGLQTLPWACRIEAYGRMVRILGTKNRVLLGARPPSEGVAIAALLTDWLGIPVVAGGGLTAMTLANTGQLLHPGLMCVHLRRWARQPVTPTPMPPAPLFYQDAGDEGAALVAAMSGEVMSVRAAVCRATSGALNLGAVVDVFAWLLACYRGQIVDESSFARALATNRAYQGIRVPIREDGRSPDLSARYLVEDIPYGLAVTKGLAELAELPTPTIDGVLDEAGSWLGVRYVRDGHLVGAGLADTRAPQRYGLTTLAQALEGEVEGGGAGGSTTLLAGGIG